MTSLQIGEYSAWVAIEGITAPVYNIEKTSSSASCWIASQVGKKFALNWYNTERRIPIQAAVLIDGKVCDNHIMLDARRYPDKPSGVGISYARTSDWTRRDFEFSSILTTTTTLHTVDTSMDIGTITLQLWRIEIQDVTPQTLHHRYGGATLDNQIVHERSKKAGAHHVVYGEEYGSPAPVVDMVRGRVIDSTPFVTFSFKYRPYDVLMANDIIPRPMLSTRTNVPSSSRNNEVDQKTAAQIKRLENRLNALKTKAKLVPHAGIVKRTVGSSKGKGRARGPIPPNAEIIDLTSF
ncbi:hypothetical protein DFP72DRAFT_872986 [Ephemerocybe angulata]|uniref:DUF7918 domain-containing protein n=1 Tax=Ephemerocybe angulata TaxID=980116 RepID=A0A8H6IGA8_9AGAR|nr:hypothetical protein DFP72DRAFT_872986 [Tulosesus angulatus]